LPIKVIKDIPLTMESTFRQFSNHIQRQLHFGQGPASVPMVPLKQRKVWFCCFVTITLLCAGYCSLYTHVTLDDAFVYFRLVAMLLETGKPVFNVGDTVFVATSPLWTFLLAGGKTIFPFLDIHILAKYFWIIFLILSSYFAYRVFMPFIGKWACIIGTPFFLSPAISSMMGNEIALLFAALFVMFFGVMYGKPIYTGLGLGTGYLARGEFVLILVPIIIHYLFVLRAASPEHKKQLMISFGWISLIAISIALLWHVYYLAIFGSFLPKTLQVKMVQGRSGEWVLYHQYVWPYLKWLLANRMFLLGFAAIGILWQPYLLGIIGCFTLLHFIIYSLLKVPYYHWYYYDFYILVLLCILLGWCWILNLVERSISQLRAHAFSRFLYYLIPQFCLFIFVIWLFSVQLDVYLSQFQAVKKPFQVHPYDMLNHLQSERHKSYLALVKLLRSKLRQGDIILVPEVGIISYYLSDYEIRDVNGLASPNVTLENINNYNYFVDRYKPQFIVNPWLRKAKGLVLFRYHSNKYIYEPYVIAAPKAKAFPTMVYRHKQNM